MPRYVAFLRAINVGGHTVKMDRLRSLFEESGFRNVETFIASGNVLFDSTAKAVPAMEKRIEAFLEAALGYEVVTFVRPLAGLADIHTGHPFERNTEEKISVHVGFLKTLPSPAARKQLMSLQSDSDEFHFGENEVYWLCRIRITDSKFSGPFFEKTLGGRATFRSVTTVGKLAAKAEPPKKYLGLST